MSARIQLKENATLKDFEVIGRILSKPWRTKIFYEVLKQD